MLHAEVKRRIGQGDSENRAMEHPVSNVQDMAILPLLRALGNEVYLVLPFFCTH